MLHQIVSRLHGSTCGKQVVVNEHHVVFVDGIGVNFDGVVAIFFQVSSLARFGRQLARFARHDKSCIQFFGQHSPHYESPAFDAHHFGDALVLIKAHQFVEHFVNTLRIFEECAHVLKVDTRFGKVGNVSQVV